MGTVLVTGYALLEDWGLVRRTLDRLLARLLPGVRVLHCCRIGADYVAEGWAADRGLEYRAVLDENLALEQADTLVAFTAAVWWWRQNGEAQLAARAQAQGKSVRLIRVPVPAPDARKATLASPTGRP